MSGDGPPADLGHKASCYPRFLDRQLCDVGSGLRYVVFFDSWTADPNYRFSSTNVARARNAAILDALYESQ